MLNKLNLSRTAFLGVFALVSTFGATFASADELTAAKKADLKVFVELTGAKTVPMAIANGQTQGMAQGIRRVDPKFPDRGLELIRDSMAGVLSENAGKPDGLYDQLATVYHTNFTHEEVKDLIKFNQSPTGKKLNELQGKLGREAMQAASKWAGQFAPDIDKRMRESLAKENIKLPEPPQQAAPKQAAPKQSAPKGQPAPAAPK